MSLSKHSHQDIVLTNPGDSRQPCPGDLVQHVNDHESLGTVVAFTGCTYAVVWSREPRLSPASIAQSRVKRAVTQIVNSFIGSPADEKMRRALSAGIHAGVNQLVHTGVLNSFTTDVEWLPAERRMVANITYAIPSPIQTYCLTVTLDA